MANKNEAKIKFTAETSDFTNQLKSANSALAALRAGLKLNDAELKNNGNQTDYLKNKQSLLQAELEANRAKQEALNGKLEAAKSIYGADSAEVQEWTTKLTRAKTEEQQLEAALGQTEAALQEQIAAEQKAQSPLEQVNTKISQQKQELEKLVTEYKNTALEQGTNSQAALELKEKINQLNSEISEEESELRKVDDALRSTDADAGSAATGGWSVLNQVIADLASNAIQQAINKLQEFAKETIQLGIDFTSSMSNVKAISGATDEQLATLEATARDLGSSTVFSASEVSDAFGYMAMAGWDTEQMLGGIEGVLNLAAASGEDLATTSDIVTDAMTAFGLRAEEAGHFADVLAATSVNANTNVGMLGESFKYVAPVAGSLGYSVEDTNIALGLMANAGIKASSAGTSLRTLLTNMAKPTDAMADAMDTLGVSLEDGNGNMLSFKEVLDQLRDGFGDLKIPQEEANEEFAKLDAALASGEITQKQYENSVADLTERCFGAEGALKAQAAATLGGKTGMSGLMAIVNASEEDYEKLTGAIYDCGGSAKTMSEIMNDNLGGDLKEMNSALEEFKLKIFESIENPLRDIIQTVTTKVVPAMTAVLSFMQKHKVALGLLGAAIGVVTGAVLLHNTVQAVKTAMNAAEATSIGALIAAKVASAAASWAALAPYILIVAAIAAVIAIIVICVKHWDQIKAKMLEVVATIKEKVTTAWTSLKTVTGNVMNAIKTTIANIWNGIKSTVASAVNAVKSKVQSVFNAIKSLTSTVWNGIKSAITSPIQSAKSTVSSIFSSMKSSISSTVSGIKSTISSAFNAAKTAITSPIESAKNTLSSIVSKIKGLFPVSFGHILSFSLPSISVSAGSPPWGIGGKGTKPSFSVHWVRHAEGGIFPRSTLLPTLRAIHEVGEDGPEAIAPINLLQDYVGDAVRENMPQPIDYDRLAEKIAGVFSRIRTSIKINDREFGRLVREVN